VHQSLSFNLNFTPGLKYGAIVENINHLFCALDLVRNTMGLHPAGRIYRITPEVIDEFMPADHASHHRTRMHPNPHRRWNILILTDRCESVLDIQGRSRDASTWPGIASGKPPTIM
jgi:hypothetical protein